MSDDPYATTGHGSSPTQSRSPFATIIKVIVVIAILLVVVCLMLPAKTRHREAARPAQCKNNLKWIGLALHQYESAYGTLPPAYTVDAEGKPLHSWRTLLLPYLDQQTLYAKIDLSKPWTDPANAEAFDTVVLQFACPSAKSLGKTQTTYLAIVAKDGWFRPHDSRTLSKSSDKLATTWVVIEVPVDQAVHWMAPLDTSEQSVLAIGPKSKLAHPGRVHVLGVDDHVESMSSESTAEERLSRIRFDGNEQ